MTLDERNEKMRELYESGWTFAELTDEFELHPGHISKLFARRGWPARRSGPFSGRGRYWD